LLEWAIYDAVQCNFVLCDHSFCLLQLPNV
jgi:hypothetical protein